MICCGHILSNPFKEEVLPDPGRLAVNRHQRAEDMDKTGNYEDYVSKWLYYRDSPEWRQRVSKCACACVYVMVSKVIICVGKAEDILMSSGLIRVHREYKSGLFPLSHGKAVIRNIITGDRSMVFLQYARSSFVLVTESLRTR